MSKTYACEEDKMLKTSIEMSFFIKVNDLLKMGVIYMCVNSEQTFEYGSNNI